jgi:Tfp pilus assembly protein PilX
MSIYRKKTNERGFITMILIITIVIIAVVALAFMRVRANQG